MYFFLWILSEEMHIFSNESLFFLCSVCIWEQYGTSKCFVFFGPVYLKWGFSMGFAAAWAHIVSFIEWDAASSCCRDLSCGICLLCWMNLSPLTSRAWHKILFLCLRGCRWSLFALWLRVFDAFWNAMLVFLDVFYTWIRLCCIGLHLSEDFFSDFHEGQIHGKPFKIIVLRFVFN